MPNIAATLSLNFPAITALCKGDPGTAVLNGAGAPSGLIGNNGDFYIDTDFYSIYGPKAGGVWGTGTLLNNSSASPTWDSTATTVNVNSGKWNNTYSFVGGNSARYQTSFNSMSSLSARWESNYTTTRAYSARWETTYLQVSALSASWGVGGSGPEGSSAYTTLCANSANWNSTYTTVYQFSGGWGGGGGPSSPDLAVRALTANYQTTFSTVSTLSSRWETAYTTVINNQTNWNWAYNNSLTGTDDWNEAYTNSFRVTLSGDYWDSVYGQVNALSSNWNGTATQVALNSSYWDTAFDLISSRSTFGGTGLIISAQDFWNPTYISWLSATQLMFDQTLNPAYPPTAIVSRESIFDNIVEWLTNYRVPIEATLNASFFKPLIVVATDSELPAVPGATNTYSLSSELHNISNLLKRTIANTSTTNSYAIRIPSSTSNWPVGSQVDVLQLGTTVMRISAESPTVLRNRWGTVGSSQRVTSVTERYTLLKATATDWYVLSTSQ